MHYDHALIGAPVGIATTGLAGAMTAHSGAINWDRFVTATMLLTSTLALIGLFV